MASQSHPLRQEKIILMSVSIYTYLQNIAKNRNYSLISRRKRSTMYL